MARRVNNTAGNTYLGFFPSRQELKRLKVALSQATLGEILELCFAETLNSSLFLCVEAVLND